MYWGLIGLKLSICLLLYVLSIWRLVPLGLMAYERWHKSQMTKDLANMVVCSMFALCFLLFIGVVLMRLASASDEIFSYAYGVTRIVFVLGITYFISYFTAPKTIKFFQKWKETKQIKYFSRMTLLGSLSAYAFLVILALFLPTKIGF